MLKQTLKRSNWRRTALVGCFTLLSTSIAACTSSGAETTTTSPTAETSTDETAPVAAVDSAVTAAGQVASTPLKRTYEDFQQSNFDENSINVTNKYFPMKPGTRHEYDGSTLEEGKTLSHRVVFTVTNLTKVIQGVNTVVIWERDFSDGELEEDELTFFAQDKLGNVWHLGQYSELWDAKEYTAGRTWFVGHPSDAKAGIMMKADPKANQPDWSEGYAPPPYFWTDRSRVRAVNQKTTVPAGTFSGVLVTEEYNEEEPSSKQLKYYAPGVGFVRVGWAGTDESKETLLMVRTEMLSADKLAEASAGALELETRALVYSTADPSVLRK